MEPICEVLESATHVAIMGPSQRTHYVDVEIMEAVMDIIVSVSPDIVFVHAGLVAFDDRIVHHTAQQLGVNVELRGPAEFRARLHPYRRDPFFIEGCAALIIFEAPGSDPHTVDPDVCEAAEHLGIPMFAIPRLWERRKE
jgi:hypothetical protein